MIKKWAGKFGLGLAVSLLTASLALAAQPDLTGVIPSTGQVDLPTGATNVAGLVALIFNVAIVAAGVIFLILLLVGGIMYLTAAGNEEATGKAKRLMVDAIVGLILVLVAYPVGLFILDKLGFNVPGGGFIGIP